MQIIINPRHAQFVAEYVKTMYGEDGTIQAANGTQAALACGYKPKAAYAQASVLLKRPEIAEAIALRIQTISAQRGDTAGMTPAKVMQMWVDLATADPSDLMEFRQLNCRHCWCVGGAYQWDAREYADAAAKAMNLGEDVPLMEGGDGWNKNADPNPDCTACGGDGVPDVLLKDTRKLKGKARLLFAGLKQTQHGVEIKLRDQDAALANIAKAMGMFVERRELSGPNGGPVPVASVNVNVPVDPVEASRLYQSIMEGKAQ